MKKLFWVPLLFLTACSATRAPKIVLQPETPPPIDDSTLRYSEVIRAYHLGRYIDPNDDLVLHEQHVLYRVEENHRWNLHPNSAAGNAAVAAPIPHDTAFSPTPVTDAVLAEVNAQKLATVQIILESKRLSIALAQFQAALQQTKTNLQETAILRASVIEMQKRLNVLDAAQTLASPASNSLTNEPVDSFNSENMPPLTLTPP